jgi:F-type H+-transporting ATPase subunit delta
MITHFQRLVRLELERRTAHVQSVIPLPPPFQSSLQGNITARYGPGLRFDFAQNSDLIGGLRVQVGSDVYDGTIRARLKALVESF